MPPKKTETTGATSDGGKLEKAEQRLEKEGGIQKEEEEGKDDTEVEFEGEEGEAGGGEEDELEKLEHKLEEEGVDHEKEAQEEEADDAETTLEGEQAGEGRVEGTETQGKVSETKGEKKAPASRSSAKGGTKSGTTPRKAAAPRGRKPKQAPVQETTRERESEGETRSSQEEEGKGAEKRPTRKRGAAKTEETAGKKQKPETVTKSPPSTPKKVSARGKGGVSSAAGRAPAGAAGAARAASWAPKDLRALMDIMIPKTLGGGERPTDWKDVAQQFNGRSVEGLRQKWTSLRKQILDHFGQATETEE